MKDYIKEAEKFLGEAFKEFADAKRDGKDRLIRDAAGKSWNAALQATNALFVIFGKTVPKSHFERRKKLEKLALEHHEIEERGFRKRYMARIQILHENCFYEGIYELPLFEKEFQKIRRYIEDVKKLRDKR